MYCRTFACDFDGTGAANGQLAPEVAAALSAARAQGIETLLVTGRVLEDVQSLCPDLSMFDAVVAENGAIIFLPISGRIIQLGEPPPEQFLGELRVRHIPFHAGAVVVGTWDRHAGELLQLTRHFAVDGQLIFNREAMMLLPSGVNKAVGTRRALNELGRSARNMIAFGDAENDLPLFALAEVGIAARGAVPAIARQADDQLSQPGGAGVAQYIHHVLQAGGRVPTPSRHQVALGVTADERTVMLPASGVNVMITGDPRSGKSWLAGLVAEQLLERGYRLCIIDPEGDFTSLGQRPGVLLLGNDLSLPGPASVPRVLRDEAVSVVLNVAQLRQHDQIAYVDALLCELERYCALTGIPQWIVIDEAQYFFNSVGPSRRRFEGTANFLFTTYRPSLVSDDVYAAVGAHLITHTSIEEERYFITTLLQARGPRDLVASDVLAQLGGWQAGLLLEDSVRPRWEIFTPGNRITAHAHHARKYSDTRLPEDKAFRFLSTDGSGAPVAHNVVEFHSAVQTVPLASLRHHLVAGDFSRWVGDVLGDQQLARGLQKLERAVRCGATPDRAEILAHVEDHYLM